VLSLREVISAAEAARQVPSFPPGDIGALAKASGLAPPVALTELISWLDGLPFITATYSSGPLTAGYVHGSAQLGVQSDGQVSFRGHVEEHGITGDNFTFLAALEGVTDASGATLAFAHQGNVEGTGNIFGHHTADFQVDYPSNQAIVNQWGTAQNTTVNFKLSVSLNIGQLTEGLVSGLFGFEVILIILSGSGSGSGGCTWSGSASSGTGQLQQCAGEDTPPGSG
jgi:hypothetical protein